MKYLQASLVGVLLVAAVCGCEYTPAPAAPVDPSTWQTTGRHVVAFTSDSCRQCQVDKPGLQKLRDQGISVVEIDVNEHPAMARDRRVQRLPTYDVIEDGEQKARCTTLAGLLAFLRLALWIASFL